MLKSSQGSVGIAVIMIVFAFALSIANLVVFAVFDSPSGFATPPAEIVALLRGRYAVQPGAVLFLGGAPLWFCLLAAVVGRRKSRSRESEAAAMVEVSEEPAGPPPEAAALRLLAVLQQEARFIDFIREDIDGYDDAQVGAAARSIHSGCRSALDGRVVLEHILKQEEGAQVMVEWGFNPSEIRLSGNVKGQPPFRGTLAHAGWRVTQWQLPQSPGDTDPSIITPAEVEIA